MICPNTLKACSTPEDYEVCYRTRHHLVVRRAVTEVLRARGELLEDQ